MVKMLAVQNDIIAGKYLHFISESEMFMSGAFRHGPYLFQDCSKCSMTCKDHAQIRYKMYTLHKYLLLNRLLIKLIVYAVMYFVYFSNNRSNSNTFSGIWRVVEKSTISPIVRKKELHKREVSQTITADGGGDIRSDAHVTKMHHFSYLTLTTQTRR